MSDNMISDNAFETALPAALLDGFDPVDPSRDVWSGIVAELNHVSPKDSAEPEVDRSAPRWFPWLLSAAAIVTLVLGVVALVASQRPDVVASHQLVDPASAAAVLSVDTDGSGISTVVSSDLPALSDGETYQLWAVTGGEVVSVGLLGADPVGASFRMEGAPSVLAVTVEVEGGVAVSAEDPVAVWQA